MPRGDQAILDDLNGRLNESVLVRLARSLRLSESVGRSLDSFAAKIGENRKFVQVGGISGVVAIVILLAIILFGRAGKIVQDTAEASVPRPKVVSIRRPATPHAAPAPIPVPSFAKDYKILASRSIFSAGGAASVSSSRSSSGSSASSAAASAAAVLPSPPLNLTLKGILSEDARVTAYVENTVNKQMIEVHAGEALGQGRVVSLTASELVYEVGGKTARIQVGQGLDGTMVAVADATTAMAVPKAIRKKKQRVPAE